MSFNNWTTLTIKSYDMYNVQKIESDAINIAVIEFPKNKNFEKIQDLLTTPLSKPGIYILKSLDSNGIKEVYVGETKNGLFWRTSTDSNHFWNKHHNIYSVLYIYSITNPLSGDDLIYLEKKFIQALRKFESKKCQIRNGNEGNQPTYKNDSFIIHEKTILFKSIIDLIEKLNNNYFLELQDDDTWENSIEKDIYLTTKDEENISSDIITIYPKNNKQIPFKFNKKTFKVLIPKGTPVNTNILERNGVQSIVRLIKKLEKENCIKNNQFVQDVWIRKPSPAAGIIQGSSNDGWLYWVTEDNEPINIFRNVEAIK